jgi:hypothetical protein
MIADAMEDMENLSLSSQKTSSSSPLWNGLVLHHKDIFVSHVIPKLNGTDRYFFSKVNRESRDVLKYAGLNVSKLCWNVHECSSISTLEFLWNISPWGKKDEDGTVRDQAWFCTGVAQTNKLEFLKWAREVKQCEWDEETIKTSADKGNIEMLKYCFSNDCPCDKQASCIQAAGKGHLDCIRFLVDKLKPSRKTEKDAAMLAAQFGHTDILKCFVEERKISLEGKFTCVGGAAMFGRLDCLKYLVEEAKVPIDKWHCIAWQCIACARYFEHPDCLNYFREKGCPEPTDEEYAEYKKKTKASEQQING